MPFLSDLHRTVQATIASKRLGTPVFIRYQLHTTDKPAAIAGRFAQILAAVTDWANQPIDRVYAVGSAKNGQVSLTVEFRPGASALLSWTTAPPRGSGIDIMVLGNHGVLYHDAGQGKLWDEALALPAEKPDQNLVALVERALQSGRPEALKGGSR